MNLTPASELNNITIYELWEADKYDGCVDLISKIDTFTDMKSAVCAAVNCRRPGLEIIFHQDGHQYFLSHLEDENGCWIHR